MDIKVGDWVGAYNPRMKIYIPVGRALEVQGITPNGRFKFHSKYGGVFYCRPDLVIRVFETKEQGDIIMQRAAAVFKDGEKEIKQAKEKQHATTLYIIKEMQ